MIIGSIWFGPRTFFPIWWRAIGKQDNEGPSGTPLTWILLILMSIVQAIFMALMVNAMGSMTTGGATLASGATAGFILWLGFVAPISLTHKLFAGQYKAWALEAGNSLITMVVMGAILGAWH